MRNSTVRGKRDVLFARNAVKRTIRSWPASHRRARVNIRLLSYYRADVRRVGAADGDARWAMFRSQSNSTVGLSLL